MHAPTGVRVICSNTQKGLDERIQMAREPGRDKHLVRT